MFLSVLIKISLAELMAVISVRIIIFCLWISRIRKTCPCNEYPLEHHFYNSKTGVCRGIPIFLIFAQNIDCGYTLEPPRQKILKKIPLKIFNF